MKRICLTAASAALALMVCWPAEAQQRGGGAVVRGGGAVVTRPMTTSDVGRTSTVRGPIVHEFDPRRGDDSSHLRRRIYNACHGDAPPDFCRRIYGDHAKGNTRQRIRYACFSAEEPPASLCRRVYGDNWHERRKVIPAPPMPIEPKG